MTDDNERYPDDTERVCEEGLMHYLRGGEEFYFSTGIRIVADCTLELGHDGPHSAIPVIEWRF